MRKQLGFLMLLFGMLLCAPSMGVSLGDIPDDPVGIEYTQILDAEVNETETINTDAQTEYQLVDVGKAFNINSGVFIQNQCNLQFSLEVDRFQTSRLYWEKRVKNAYLCEDGEVKQRHLKYRYQGDMPEVLRL